MVVVSVPLTIAVMGEMLMAVIGDTLLVFPLGRMVLTGDTAGVNVDRSVWGMMIGGSVGLSDEVASDWAAMVISFRSNGFANGSIMEQDHKGEVKTERDQVEE